jgi:hypothetical protein
LRELRLRFDGPKVATKEATYSFGVVIGIESPPRSDLDPQDDDLSQYITIDGFPVVAEYRVVSYGAPPSPAGATSACYARPRSSKRFYGMPWSDGIVVARHSLAGLGYALGASVPMASGTSCTIADLDSSATTIDAAILDCAVIPATATSLVLAPAIAPGSSVTVRTSATSFSAQVLRVNDHPSYYGNLVAHRVFIDAVGASGDSGSAVLRSAHRDCAGLYMGTTGGPLAEGLAQSMRQVVQYFDVDLFD